MMEPVSTRRRYQLLCPVARALDAVGDRWTLLILRDLHAGPARFQELQQGLGLATNLLSTRLGELQASGLVERVVDHTGPARHAAYGLTERGRGTDRLLWELVRFGSLLDRDPEPRDPGNLRTVALPLRMMLASVPDRPSLRVRLDVDGESFVIDTSPGGVEVSVHRPADGVDHGASGGADGGSTFDLVLSTDYLGFLDLAEGRITLDDFVAGHRRVEVGEPDTLAAFGALMATALERAAAGHV